MPPPHEERADNTLSNARENARNAWIPIHEQRRRMNKLTGEGYIHRLERRRAARERQMCTPVFANAHEKGYPQTLSVVEAFVRQAQI